MATNAGRWSSWTEREPGLRIVAEKGVEVVPSKRGSDAWLARQLVRWSGLAGRLRKVEG